MLDFLKEPEEPPEHFFSLIDEGMHGLIGFAAIHAACSLHLFDHLEKNQECSMSCRMRPGLPRNVCSPFLVSLSSSGIIISENERYKNSPLASTYLVSDSPYCQRSHIHKNAVFLEKIWARLPERLIGGPRLSPRGILCGSGPAGYGRERPCRKTSADGQ